jgi:hypothetical protein
MGWSDAEFRTFTIPTGAVSGQRIVIDGNAGTITGYDATNQVYLLINSDGVSVYEVGTPFAAGLNAGASAFFSLASSDPNATAGAISAEYQDPYLGAHQQPAMAMRAPSLNGLTTQATIYAIGGALSTDPAAVAITADVFTVNGQPAGMGVAGGAYGNTAINSAGAESGAMPNVSAVAPVFAPRHVYRATVCLGAYDNGAFPTINHSEAHIYAGNTTAKLWAGFDYMTCGGALGVHHTLVFYLKNTSASTYITTSGGPTIRVQRIAGAATVTVQNWTMEIEDLGPLDAANLAPFVAQAVTV